MTFDEKILNLVDAKLLRDLNGWKDAPVPACFGGDPRSLTFCCHPGYGLTFGFKCQRDPLLKKVGLTKEKFIKIKDEFSKENDWDDERVCFKSLSYCCMRSGGCPGYRDIVLKEKYPGLSWEEVKEKYFALKQKLALKLLVACKNEDWVKPFLDHEQSKK